ncbi:MAG: hypothetical protein Kow0042_08450 [Calditrichia bacterium]
MRTDLAANQYDHSYANTQQPVDLPGKQVAGKTQQTGQPDHREEVATPTFAGTKMLELYFPNSRCQ